MPERLSYIIEKILLVNTPPHGTAIISKSKHSKLLAIKGRQIFAYGLLSIGAYLESKGLKVDYEDMWNMNWDEIREVLLIRNPDIIFSSCLTDNRLSNFTLSKIAKELNPNVINVIGNAHATAMYEQILSNYPEVDYIVLGEGEITCYELIDCLKNNGNIKDVKGLAYRVNNAVCLTEKRPLANLDYFPFPTKYRITPDDPGVASLNTSRGCPYGCSYCSLSGYWGGRWRGRSSQKVLEEIDFVVSLGAKRIIFNEDHFTFNKKRVMELVSRFDEYNFKWSMQCRVDRIDKEMLDLFKKNRCEGIIYGVETLSPTILKNIHKGFTLEQIKKTFKMTREAGVPFQANIMIGCPGETQETINETIKGLKEFRPDSIAKFLTMVYPNTPLYRSLKERGLMSDEFWLSAESAPFHVMENDIATLRKWSLQVQIAWYKQMGILWSIKNIAELLKVHGLRFSFDYIKDGLSKVSLNRRFDNWR